MWGIVVLEAMRLLQTNTPNEFTEGAVTIEVGSLFHYFPTRIEKDHFLRGTRTLHNFKRMNPQAWSYWRNKKKEAGVEAQSFGKHIVCGYEVSTEATPV